MSFCPHETSTEVTQLRFGNLCLSASLQVSVQGEEEDGSPTQLEGAKVIPRRKRAPLVPVWSAMPFNSTGADAEVRRSPGPGWALEQSGGGGSRGTAAQGEERPGSLICSH